MCVYATGSYGRLEAWEESDADLFLLHDPKGDGRELTKICEMRTIGRLIEIVKDAGLPDPDADGRFLEIHDITKMHKELGSPNDDSVNAFTARMLLLLESRPIFRSDVYEELLTKVISFYFEDQADHIDDFEPLFLLNDVLRFWRTLTLNYEFNRRKKIRQAKKTGKTRRKEAVATTKAEISIKNYKLKFSRMTTCFSMVASLSLTPGPIDESSVLEICSRTPLDRLRELRRIGKKEARLVDELLDKYEHFLSVTQREKASLVDDFLNKKRKKELLMTATEYGDKFYELLAQGSDSKKIRYLVV